MKVKLIFVVILMCIAACAGEIGTIKKAYRQFNPPPPKYGNCLCSYYDYDRKKTIKTKCKTASSEEICDSICGLDDHQYGQDICKK